MAKIVTQVSVTKREAEIKLDETDFYEKRAINKRKKLLLEGKDPDEEEARQEKRKKMNRKLARKRARESAVKRNTQINSLDDDSE